MRNYFKAIGVSIGVCAAFSGCGTGVTVIALVSPSISQVSPQVVTAGTPSVTVTVQGANFSSNSSLMVNGTAVPTSYVSGTTLAAKISGSPLAQPNVAQLQVRNTNGGQSNQVPLTVTSAVTSPQTLSIASPSLPGAQVGVAYSGHFVATGGTPGYTWAVTSGSLPAGMTLTSGGVLSGTPTGTGTSTFVLSVTDSGSPAQQTSVTLSLVVLPVTQTPVPLVANAVTLGTAKVGSAYAVALSATGGTPGYTWTVTSGSLPAGMALSNAGVISGTPTAAGSATFTATVSDSGSPMQAATVQESITVSASASTLNINAGALASGKTGTGYSATLSATGGTPGYTWSVISGSLPAGLTLSASGVILGTPTASGIFSFTVGVQDSGSPVDTASVQESITVSSPGSTLSITAAALGAGTTGTGYSATLSATGGTPGYTWSVTSGSMPAGLTMSAGGVISGTPTASGSCSFTVGVQDSGSPVETASVQESITVSPGALMITSPNPGAGVVGTGYNIMLYASGGVPSYTWSVSSGSLPAGLTLSSTGVISGTPTTNGASSFTLTVTDNGSPAQTASAQDSITINNANQSNPQSGEQIYIYPQAPVAPQGSYQTVTAIVTGVSDKTVTWSSDGGTIVGTNPCVVNEPCTIALYSGGAGSYHLTATSNANQQVVATSAITFTASPTPRTDHPRFLMTSNMLSSLQTKANANDPMYQGIQTRANIYYTEDAPLWSFSTWNGSACVGGSGPSSDQTANYREQDAWWMSLIALLDPNPATRNQYGCAAHDVFMTDVGYVLSGELNLGNGNRWADSAEYFAFTADYLMGGGYLSASDEVLVRQYLAKLAYEQINDVGNGNLAVIGGYNSAAEFDESNVWSATEMRGMGNNYTQARILILTAAALTFNDTPMDDPALANTCNATRYQVCPDGTAGSLHAYWSYVSGGMLYKDWANLEEPSVVQQAYNLAATPGCRAPWGLTVPCLGAGRGGESSEGTFYGTSIAKMRWAMNAIQTAGYDDPILYGPQMSLGTMSYWDLRYVADLTLLTGLSANSWGGIGSGGWTFLTDGDTLDYYAYPSDYAAEAAMLSADSYIGRTDRSQALEWLVTNTAFGMAAGKTGGCAYYCGFDEEMGNDYGSTVALDMFIALPAEDPASSSNAAADPRPSLPVDWYNAGNQHIVTRSGWGTNTNTIFSYYCTNTQIDHEHEYCGGFSVYSNGEYITKGRMEFNNYDDELSTARYQNLPALINNPSQTGCTPTNCAFAPAATDGGQLWHGYQAGMDTLYHAELPGYVAAVADSTNSYNGGWGGFGELNGITGSSRSLVYLRGSNQIVYYDRGDSGSNAWDKANYLNTTGAPTPQRQHRKLADAVREPESVLDGVGTVDSCTSTGHDLHGFICGARLGDLRPSESGCGQCRLGAVPEHPHVGSGQSGGARFNQRGLLGGHALRRRPGRLVSGDVYARLAGDLRECHLSCLRSYYPVRLRFGAEHDLQHRGIRRAHLGQHRQRRRTHLQLLR